MKKVNFNEATEEQLREYGRNTLGLTLPPNCKVETLRSKISSASDKDYILVDGETPEMDASGTPPPPVTAAQKAPQTTDDAPGDDDELVRIRIHVQESPGGDEPVSVSVNGRAMRIPRDQDVDVPKKFVRVLENAIEHRFESLPDGGLSLTPKKVYRYPFQRVA